MDFFVACSHQYLLTDGFRLIISVSNYRQQAMPRRGVFRQLNNRRLRYPSKICR